MQPRVDQHILLIHPELLALVLEALPPQLLGRDLPTGEVGPDEVVLAGVHPAEGVPLGASFERGGRRGEEGRDMGGRRGDRGSGGWDIVKNFI